MFEALELARDEREKEGMPKEIEQIQEVLYNRMGGYGHPAYQKASDDFNYFAE